MQPPGAEGAHSEAPARAQPSLASGEGASPPLSPLPFWFWAGLVLALATWLRFFGLDFGLPHLEARPDETQVVERTAAAARGRFAFDWSIYPHAYVYAHWLWGEALLHLQALVGLAESSDYAATWKSEPQRLYWIGRAGTATAGIASVALVLSAMRRRLDPGSALLGGLLLATCLLHVRDSHAYKPDVLMALGVTLAVVAAARLASQCTLKNGVLAGLAVGFAAAAKYNGVIAAVPVCVAAWMGSSATGWRRLLPLPLLLAGAVSALFFLATSPFLLFNETSIAMLQQALSAVFPSLVAAPESGPLPSLDTLVGPEAPAWAASKGAFSGYWYHVAFSMWHGLGVVQTLLVFPAILWAVLRGETLVRLSAVFCVAWFVVVGFSPVMLSRYLTPLLPALAVVLGAAALRFVQVFSASALPQRGQRVLLWGATALLLVAQPLYSSASFGALAAQPDTRVLAQEWMAQQLPAGSRVAIYGTQFWNWAAPRVPKGLHTARFDARRRVERQRLDYLVTHDHWLFWSTADPAVLRANARHLEEIADFNPQRHPEEAALFETFDAFYLPVANFSAVDRGGPRIRIYRVR